MQWAGVPAASRHRLPPAPARRAPREAGCPVLEGARRAGGGDAGRAAWRADPDRPPAPYPGGTRLPALALEAGCLWGHPLKAPVPALGGPAEGCPSGGCVSPAVRRRPGSPFLPPQVLEGAALSARRERGGGGGPAPPASPQHPRERVGVGSALREGKAGAGGVPSPA